LDNLKRRDFLRLSGFAGLAAAAPAILAACGDDDDDTPTPTATTPAATGTATGTATATGTSTATAGPPEARQLRVGYLPITDATPLLLAHANGYYEEAGLEVAKPTLFRSWPQIVEAFQARQVDIIHVLMPTAVFMRFGQRFPVKIVAWNHTDGSALTVAKNINSLDDLAGQTIGIPSYYSLHNVTLQILLRDAGLNPVLTGNASASQRQVKLVVMAPPDMPPALANNSIAGYIVAEPFNAVAEVNDVGKIFRFTGDVWQNHACCVVVMHEDDIERKPNWAQAAITSVARAQLFARENRQEAARLLAREGGDYLPQPLPVIQRALSHYDKGEYGQSGAIKHVDWPSNRIDFQPFPFPSYTDRLVRFMQETSVEGDAAFLTALDAAAAHAQLVDDRFARAAITAAGGPAKFGISAALSRMEVVSP
jgi:NitT/TauT family transport system substrate-binding protein